MNGVTVRYIEKHKTERGGWTKEFLDSIGVGWPPWKGWKKYTHICDGYPSPVGRPCSMCDECRSGLQEERK